MWHTYELEQVNYQNKCRLIRGWDDLFTKVKEHINSVSAMKLSPYYKVSNPSAHLFPAWPLLACWLDMCVSNAWLCAMFHFRERVSKCTCAQACPVHLSFGRTHYVFVLCA